MSDLRRAAVLGHPIAHSLSPVLHRAAYRELGLDWTYDAVDLTESKVVGFVESCGPEWAGLSVTAPLKKAILPALTEVTDVGRQVGAVNTVIFDGDRRVGDNTDVFGMVQALRAQGVTNPDSVGIIGAGGTAAAALVAAAQLAPAEILISARRPEAVEALVAIVGAGMPVVIVPWEQRGEALAADVVMVTLPGDAAAPLTEQVPSQPGTLLDVTYHPWPTTLASAWTIAGGAVAPGFSMLLWQATQQVHLMTGQEAPVAAMAEALQAALSSR